MRLAKVKLQNFRSFSDEEVITLSDLSAIIGSNSSGKTTFFNALLKLFGESSKDREITRADFHLPAGTTPDGLIQSELWIESIFDFPEVTKENGIEKYTVPPFFNNFVIEPGEGRPPYIRIRLEATWQRSNQPEGIVVTNLYFVTAPESTPLSPQEKRPISQTQISQIKIIYVPALRDPSVQLRMVSGTLLWRLIQRINFDSSFKLEISQKMQGVKEILNKHQGVTQIKEIIGKQWNEYHADTRYTDVDLHFITQDIESILRKIDPFFSPTEIENGYTVDSLGDGLRSLFYLSLVASLLKTEEITLKEMLEDPDRSIDERMFSIIPPCLTIVCVEEPENHVAPHLLGRIIQNLQTISNNSNSQVILSSHSPAIIKRIDPSQIRHFRTCKTKRSTLIRSILLPNDSEEAYKYVKEAIRAYPEVYFSSLVILGEGDSEEIIIPHFMDLVDLRINFHEVSVVPLGGRHVNHFWKLLYQLDIPFITLLDLDLERDGGGWGRVKYCLVQLIENGIDKAVLLETADGETLSDKQLEGMHSWDPQSENLQTWVDFLESYNIFFSAPLDIDFLMLEAYLDHYLAGISDNEGPAVKIGTKNKKISKLSDAEKASAEFLARINSDVATTLKDDSKKGELYSEQQRRLMVWYKYFFLYRGKPSTHMRILSETENDTLIANMPTVFKDIGNIIKQKLNIKDNNK